MDLGLTIFLPQPPECEVTGEYNHVWSHAQSRSHSLMLFYFFIACARTRWRSEDFQESVLSGRWAWWQVPLPAQSPHCHVPSPYQQSLKIINHKITFSLILLKKPSKRMKAGVGWGNCTMLAPSFDNTASSSFDVLLGGTGMVSCLRIGPISNLARKRQPTLLLVRTICLLHSTKRANCRLLLELLAIPVWGHHGISETLPHKQGRESVCAHAFNLGQPGIHSDSLEKK